MKRPRLKRVHAPIALPGDRILIGLMQYGVASEIQDTADGTIARLLDLMDGSRTVEQICAELVKAEPELDGQSVREVVDDLIDGGFVEDAGADMPGNLSAREAHRYEPARNFLAWIDTTPRGSPYEIQSRIKDARVSLLGLGGTGSAVAMGLVASGIGALHVGDFDVIEEPNLTRQLLYTEKDIGRSKVDCAVNRLRRMNSLVTVTGTEIKAGCPDDIAHFIADSDVLVLCADEPQPDIMFWANEAAQRTSTPLFISFYTGPMAVVGSFVPGETGCWACMRRQEDQREFNAYGQTTQERPNAVIAASANVSGQLCALEVLYHLGGLPTQTRGRVYHWNYAHWDHFYFIDVPRFDDCTSCGHHARQR